jgi:cation transport regulator
MPYHCNADLPQSVRRHLPEHAQAIYREAFNHALEEYKDPRKRRDAACAEQVAYRVAWSAVKRKYQKNDESGDWELIVE